MAKKRGEQKGAQQHAEGQHGPKTEDRLQEMLQSGPSHEQPDKRSGHEEPGKHRLFERREQHDEADLNSEKTRLSRDIDRHDHVRENFQVVGGAESHPVMPESHIDPAHPDRPAREHRSANRDEGTTTS